jgi:transposase
LDKDKIISELILKIEHLTLRLEQTERENRILRKENQELKERLSRYEHPKNSGNSSIPPSKDENRPKPNTSLREKTGRRPGGQTGHKGNTLKMVSNPDIVDEHKPCYCGGCGNDLSKLPFEFAGKRQVIDVPEIKLHVTEHRIYSKVCSCGHVTTSDFPLTGQCSCKLWK